MNPYEVEHDDEPNQALSECPYRNLISSILSSAIHDLSRYKEIRRLGYVEKKNAKNWYQLTCSSECAITFDDCLNSLGFSKLGFIGGLIKQGLLPPQVILKVGTEVRVIIDKTTLSAPFIVQKDPVYGDNLEKVSLNTEPT